MICRLCFLPWWYRVTPDDTIGLSLCLLTPMCGRLKEKWRSLAIARFPAEKCNKETEIVFKKKNPEKEQNFNTIIWLILHFYFPENVLFLRGVTLSVVSQSSPIWRGMPGSEFQEKGIFGRSVFEPGSALLHLLLQERERERDEAECNHELPALTFPLKGHADHDL